MSIEKREVNGGQQGVTPQQDSIPNTKAKTVSERAHWLH